MRVATLAFVVLALAGCGGSAGVSGGAASLLPSTTDAFVAIETHVNASQWPAIEALLRRFPVQDPVLGHLQTLGGEVSIASVGNSLVVLTRSSNVQPAGFVAKRISGWTAFARRAATFDSLGGHATLASSQSYKTAMATIPSHGLARAYAGPSAARHLVTALPDRVQVLRVPFGRRGPGVGPPTANERTVWAAAAVVAGSHSVTLEAHARILPPANVILSGSVFMQVPEPEYQARLIDEIPADALAVADFQPAPSEFELTDTADLPAPVQALAKKSATFLNALDTVLGGETAIYARAGGEVTLVTQPSDTKTASEQVAALAPFFPGVTLHTTVFGGELVVSTSLRGLAAFRAAGAKLSADPTFRQAKVPTDTTGFIYGDLRSGSSGFAVIAPLFGLLVPTSPEHTLLSYGMRRGNEATSVLVLQTG
ncbi:MAG TPA: hypothetical protein VFM96_03545 [Gaiellaceae bacterium]|nr:hypothetical protein [Gaiellaceae bacterium]